MDRDDVILDLVLGLETLAAATPDDVDVEEKGAGLANTRVDPLLLYNLEINACTLYIVQYSYFHCE